MQRFLSLLGKFFRGFSIFLTIVHHLIWISIGGAILIGAYYILSIGGPGKLIQQAIPAQLMQSGNNQSSGQQNSNQQNPNQQNGSNGSQISDQQKQCVITILGQARVSQLLSGSKPTALEYTKIQKCFPNGYNF